MDANYTRPRFTIGHHDSKATAPPSETEYGILMNAGVGFVTTPITNSYFHDRVKDLVTAHIHRARENAGPLADIVIPPLTPEDTSLFPCRSVTTYSAYASPWIDLASTDPVISSVSRQVLNLEIAHASFCGVRSVIVPGPRRDSSRDGGSEGVLQYARAVQEAMTIASRLSFIIHMPMYREPGLDEDVPTLSALSPVPLPSQSVEIDLYSAWDSWHTIRTLCEYSIRLFVGVRIPRVLPEKELQNRWFAEPLHFLSFGPNVFRMNKSEHPALHKQHQEMIFTHMRLKHTPWLLLTDVGPGPEVLAAAAELHENSPQQYDPDFPALPPPKNTQSHRLLSDPMERFIAHVEYLQYLQGLQPQLSANEKNTLTPFQDWLQSPLQPLSDNLESATYEVFEADPVKYNQYEAAITQALAEWQQSGRGTSSKDGAVVIAVAGSGRGPLVARALRASKTTGVPVQVWAVEKNPNAYVYLLKENEMSWGSQVTVVKTDMRAWKGPLLSGTAGDEPVYGKVDILVSELLGSFGDNELSPECLDGVQHVLAPHGISIPESYTAHMSPIATPRIHADLLTRLPTEPDAFNTTWVVHLFAIDFAAQRVPNHPRFQQAWEFSHPLPEAIVKQMETRRAAGVMGGGGGSMAGAVGANDHNSRCCHLKFVCRNRGVVHGLAGYFESVLYTPVAADKKKVEISTHPELIDQKSKDMISWFPIFFPVKQPLYYPADTELEVTMWRQTDDSKVWYEWIIEAYTWVSEKQRIKVASSGLCSSRKVACLM